ncbi:hypothetical protein ABZ412_35795 [Nocardia sp. NPDC005746]|uniref:hypothetical protein n=1 Tax=Nocardia sp. NPDC005746 TaxID=3157062 RepID=UPI0033C1C52E
MLTLLKAAIDLASKRNNLWGKLLGALNLIAFEDVCHREVDDVEHRIVHVDLAEPLQSLRDDHRAFERVCGGIECQLVRQRDAGIADIHRPEVSIKLLAEHRQHDATAAFIRLGDAAVQPLLDKRVTRGEHRAAVQPTVILHPLGKAGRLDAGLEHDGLQLQVGLRGSRRPQSISISAKSGDQSSICP